MPITGQSRITKLLALLAKAGTTQGAAFGMAAVLAVSGSITDLSTPEIQKVAAAEAAKTGTPQAV